MGLNNLLKGGGGGEELGFGKGGFDGELKSASSNNKCRVMP